MGWASFEEQAEKALVRIADGDCGLLGTGAVITNEGHILTCHHVVDGLPTIQVKVADTCHPVAVSAIDPDRDLAVLFCPGLPIKPLPVASARSSWQGTPYWTAGFQHQTAALEGSLPARGDVGGAVMVRYRGRSRRYRLQVLTLLGHVFGEGLSGAPVIDLTSGAVLGIVTSRFQPAGAVSGFAVPLASDAFAAADVEKILQRNRAEVPRFGSQLNGPGATQLCGQQRRARINQYTLDRVYLPERAVDRPRLREQVREFEAHGARVIPVIGPSGTGKSHFLTGLAAGLVDEHAAVLLRGLDVEAAHRDISDLVAVEAKTENGPLAPEEDTASVIATAAQETGKPLTVLLDGLNEAQGVLGGSLRTWLSRSASWLRSANATLVVSSRPEFWELAHDILDTRLGRRDGAEDIPDKVIVVDFDDDELAEARRRYEMPTLATGRHLTPPAQLERHPLFLRLMWETTLTPAHGNRNSLDLFEEYVDNRCRAVALTVGRTRSFVRYQLDNAIMATLGRGDLWQPREMFFASFASTPEVGELLVEEHVFTAARNGYSVTFDRVGEFLQSSHVSFVPAVDLATDTPRALPGTQYFVALRAERERRYEELATWLDAAIRSFAAGHYRLAWILADIFVGLDNPSRFLRQAQRFARAAGSSYLKPGGSSAQSLLLAWRLPASDRLGLAQLLARGEKDYGWRQKDWRRSFEVSRSFSTSHLADDLVRFLEQEPAVVPKLVGWLDDDTPLQSTGLREANVADVGGALLSWFGYLALRDTCEALADRPGKGSREILVLMCEHWPNEMYGILLEWVSGNSVIRHQIALACVKKLAEQGAHTISPTWVDLLRLLRDSHDPHVQAGALALHAALEPESDALVGSLLDLFARKSTTIDPSVLGPFTASRPDVVLNALQHELDPPVDPNRLARALFILNEDMFRDADTAPRIASLVEGAWKHSLGKAGVAYAVAACIREMLRVSYRDARLPIPAVLLVEEVLADPDVPIRLDLVHTLTAVPGHETASRFRSQVLEIIASQGDNDLLRWELEGLAEAHIPTQDAGTIAMVVGHLADIDAERAVLALAYFDYGFARMLLSGAGVAEMLARRQVTAKLVEAYGQTGSLDGAFDLLFRSLVATSLSDESDLREYVLRELAEAKARDSAGRVFDLMPAIWP